MSSTEDKPKSKIPAHLRGVFINGRRVITKGCGATLRTIDPCFMPNGKIQKFDNVALDSDAIQESTFVFVNNQPVLTLNSKLKTTYGSEAASAGVKSGTIAGECTFLTGSPNTFAEGFAIIRDGDLALANNANTEPAPMVHPDRYILKEDSLVEYQALKEAHPIPSTAPLAIKFVYTYGKPLAYQNCVLRLKTSQRLLGVDLKEGVGVIPLTAIEKAEDTLIIDNFEMIDVQSGFPTHYQEIPLKGRDEILIELLPPPIVVNLREPPRSCEKTPSLLSKQAIQYFLDNGQNALIFIHGYNVPLGQLGHYLKDYEISSKHLHLKASPYRRSIACDINHPAEIC
ncbi:MAG: hypothetical protein JWM09_257, partial [Francisellaceae bacterium]|nr:hypothetical protein [Francisellaceae bacterium]